MVIHFDRFVFVEFVFHGVDKGMPAGFDNVLAHTDRTPQVMFIGTLDVGAWRE